MGRLGARGSAPRNAARDGGGDVGRSRRGARGSLDPGHARRTGGRRGDRYAHRRAPGRRALVRQPRRGSSDPGRPSHVPAGRGRDPALTRRAARRATLHAPPASHACPASPPRPAAALGAALAVTARARRRAGAHRHPRRPHRVRLLRHGRALQRARPRPRRSSRSGRRSARRRRATAAPCRCTASPSGSTPPSLRAAAVVRRVRHGVGRREGHRPRALPQRRAHRPAVAGLDGRGAVRARGAGGARARAELRRVPQRRGARRRGTARRDDLSWVDGADVYADGRVWVARPTTSARCPPGLDVEPRPGPRVPGGLHPGGHHRARAGDVDAPGRRARRVPGGARGAAAGADAAA
jgi:hypothetical protein